MADDAACASVPGLRQSGPRTVPSPSSSRQRAAGVAQRRLFDQLFAPAMSILGGAWASGEIDEYTFTQAAVVAEQVTSFVIAPSTAQDSGVTVLVGTMHHDLHAIDKDITAGALKEAGHRVIDLGVDVRPSEFLERAEETGARIVIVFAQTIGTARDVVAGTGDVSRERPRGPRLVRRRSAVLGRCRSGQERGCQRSHPRCRERTQAGGARRAPRQAHGRRRGDRPQRRRHPCRGPCTSGPGRAGGRRRATRRSATRSPTPSCTRCSPTCSWRATSSSRRYRQRAGRSNSIRSALLPTCRSVLPTTAAAACGTSRYWCGTSWPRSFPTS